MTFKPLPRVAAGGLSQNGLPYLIVLAHVLYSCASTVIFDSPRSTLQQSKGFRLRVACSSCLLAACLASLAALCCGYLLLHIAPLNFEAIGYQVLG